MEKLKLNDASLTFEPESSMALGFAVEVLDVAYEIIQERLDREFNNVITTVPNVSYYAHTKKGDVIQVNNPSDLPKQPFRKS